MSSAMDQTRKTRTDILFSMGKLYKLLEDNSVVAGKAEMTALKALVDALDTAVQAKSQTPGSDFNELL